MKNKIHISSNLNIWPHEHQVALALLDAGYTVYFIKPSDSVRSADIHINGIPFEIKSPRGNGRKALERNLKRASRQSCNVVIDSSRIKSIQDHSIQSFLITKLKTQPTLKRILFVNRKRQVIDINQLI